MSVQAYVARRRFSSESSRQAPTPLECLLHPERWIGLVARKLRDGALLEDWERQAAASALERVAGVVTRSSRRGRLPDLKSRILRNSAVFAVIQHHREKHPHAALSDDQTFEEVRIPLKKLFDLKLTAVQIRKAYYADKKRRESEITP